MGDAVRLAAESLGISDVFWNNLIPLAPRTALVCTIKKTKDNNLCVVHGVSFNSRTSSWLFTLRKWTAKLWNVGSKPVFRCQGQKIRIPQAGALEEQHTSSGASRIRSRSTPAHPEGITHCVTSVIECILHFNFVHESLKITMTLKERNPS